MSTDGSHHPAMTNLSPVWTHLSDVVVTRAEGCYLYDQNRDRYLDFTSGIGVTNAGHCQPRVVTEKQIADSLHILEESIDELVDT